MVAELTLDYSTVASYTVTGLSRKSTSAIGAWNPSIGLGTQSSAITSTTPTTYYVGKLARYNLVSGYTGDTYSATMSMNLGSGLVDGTKYFLMAGTYTERSTGGTIDGTLSNYDYVRYNMGYYRTTTKTLSYNANGGSGAPSSQISYWSTTATGSIYKHVLSSTAPTWSGHTFQGWATSSSATTAAYQPGDDMSTSSSTLYAVWATTYKLSFNANGGSGAPSAQTATSNAKTYDFTIPTTTPTKTGSNFLGWATSSSATTAAYQPGDSYSVPASSYTKTLYAVWEAVPTAPPLRIKVGGAWKTADGVYIKVGGTWKEATDVYVKAGGAWEKAT